MAPRLVQVHLERALISESGLSLSKAGLLTGRQALTTPSRDSRLARSEISAYCSTEFVALISYVSLIRTRVMMQMLLQRLAAENGWDWKSTIRCTHGE